MNTFNQIANLISETICQVQENEYSLSNQEKKQKVINVANKFYDEFIDKPFQLPEIIDFLVKTAIIPGMIEFIFYELKSAGVIEMITQKVIKNKAKHLGGDR